MKPTVSQLGTCDSWPTPHTYGHPEWNCVNWTPVASVEGQRTGEPEIRTSGNPIIWCCQYHKDGGLEGVPCPGAEAVDPEGDAAYWRARAETAELKVLTFHEEIAKLKSVPGVEGMPKWKADLSAQHAANNVLRILDKAVYNQSLKIEDLPQAVAIVEDALIAYASALRVTEPPVEGMGAREMWKNWPLVPSIARGLSLEQCRLLDEEIVKFAIAYARSLRGAGGEGEPGAREPHDGWLNVWLYSNQIPNESEFYRFAWHSHMRKMAGDWADFLLKNSLKAAESREQAMRECLEDFTNGTYDKDLLCQKGIVDRCRCMRCIRARASEVLAGRTTS